MYGDQALRLVTECRNMEATGSLKPYNESLVRLILLETRQIHTSLSTLLSSLPPGTDVDVAAQSDLSLGAQLLTLHHSAQRNKRCLLAYHEWRMGWLKRRLWARGGALGLVLEEKEERGSTSSVNAAAGGEGQGAGAGAAARADVRSKLSPQELTWLRDYASLVTAFKSEFLDITDLTAPLGQAAGRSHADGGGSTIGWGPPKELMVTVVATRDAREVMTEMGMLNLRRGERMRVRRTEVEGLIVRGWLEVLEE